jgi:hypothetical protein
MRILREDPMTSPHRPFRGFTFVEGLPDRMSLEGMRVARIPAAIESQADLYERIGAQLEFPDWWGRNWDALLDILSSDEWWDDPKPMVIVHEAVPLGGCAARLSRSP